MYYERPIAKELLRAASTEKLPADFTCHEVQYTLLRYSARPEERFYNKYRESHVVRRTRIARHAEIFVCLERCRCTSCFGKNGFDSLENVCDLVKLRDDYRRVAEIDVQHCTHCGSYFIDKESLVAYEQGYGLLCITKRHITGNEADTWQRPSITYKEDTIFSRNGYSPSRYAT